MSCSWRVERTEPNAVRVTCAGRLVSEWRRNARRGWYEATRVYNVDIPPDVDAARVAATVEVLP